MLLFECVDEILKCDWSTKSYWAVLAYSAVYDAVQGGSNFWNPYIWPLKWKLLSGTVYYDVQGGSNPTIQVKDTEQSFYVVLSFSFCLEIQLITRKF